MDWPTDEDANAGFVTRREMHGPLYSGLKAERIYRDGYSDGVAECRHRANDDPYDSSPKPKWPTFDDAADAFKRRAGQSQVRDEYSYRIGYGDGVQAATHAYDTATDDPSVDLPGSVRKSPDGIVVVRSDYAQWLLLLLGSQDDGRHIHFRDEQVKGWSRKAPIPGTPAAEADR